MRPIIQLQNEMEATGANAYQVLEEWGCTGWEKRRWVRYLTSYKAARSEEEAKRIAHKRGKKG